MSHSIHYFECAQSVAAELDHEQIERLAKALSELRDRGGRLFILGVGGSAANASHAVNDFRKIAGIEAYAPTDNVAELTARTNDEGWETVFDSYLRVSKATSKDAILVFSVGGGDAVRNVSPNIVRAVDEARRRGMKVFGVVGRDGGHTKRFGDEVVVLPVSDPHLVTPLTEAFQAVVGLRVASSSQQQETKWESLEMTCRFSPAGDLPDRWNTESGSRQEWEILSPSSVEDFRPLPRVEDAIAALKADDYLLIVVTNQPDVGALRQKLEVVEAMHSKMRSLLPIDDICVCYHVEADGCACRKPAPGMILDAAATWKIDLAASYMIGDRWRDIEAGIAAGCRTVFIKNDYDERQPAVTDAVVGSLSEAADLILSRRV
jgi:D-sedoheptulose 7-phosphate isomerase